MGKRPAFSVILKASYFWALPVIVGLGTPHYATAGDIPPEIQEIRQGVIHRLQSVHEFHAQIDRSGKSPRGPQMHVNYTIDWNATHWRVDEVTNNHFGIQEGKPEQLAEGMRSVLILRPDRCIRYFPVRLANGAPIISTSTPCEKLPAESLRVRKWYLLGLFAWGDAFLSRYDIESVMTMPGEDIQYSSKPVLWETQHAVEVTLRRPKDGLVSRTIVSRDHRVLMAELESKGDLHRTTSDDWKLCDDGFYWPHRIHHEHHRNGELFSDERFQLSEVRINSGIDPKQFTVESLDFQEGDWFRIFEVDAPSSTYIWRNGEFVKR
ncbi:MAG: hypothetical protein KDA88_05955 [Planctomycetaceae bacterium]|nr:hypothetical protein [Planctomycetaceae bacterium]MCB9950569.1 hypothetical protein [Planctomycetaceae bacterium]